MTTVEESITPHEDVIVKEWEAYPMRRPYIAKVIVDMCTGGGEPLKRAATILEMLTGQKPVQSRAKQTIRDFGIRKKEPIAVRVTLRHERAVEFLRRALQAKDNILLVKNWDEDGNFAFGIKEHIDIPGVKYDPQLGIQGMNITVVIERPGFRVKRRRRRKAKVPWRHRLTPEESMVFMKREFGVEILEKERERTYLF
ncbi:MAG: 50S ribosomal protein L5 [Candidatus Thorarchaeota archaeon]|nr:MAG: 50S ribosomal protein L5 [Candidatus Thorarchaeota archaeon]RLI61470.1 MAG: 50S ribosomal protein L5 [Candidatus Thorarchaeota archaeon]